MVPDLANIEEAPEWPAVLAVPARPMALRLPEANSCHPGDVSRELRPSQDQGRPAYEPRELAEPMPTLG